VLYTAALFAALIALLSCDLLSPNTPTNTPEIIATTEVVPSPTDTVMPIPPTIEPTIQSTVQPTTNIKLGHGKYTAPIWLEVIRGNYQLTSGDTC